MKIVMFTNTYLPHVGGVARSVSTYEEEFCRRGHEVRVVAPEFNGAEESSGRVLRTPAIQNFNGSDFSFRIPVPGLLADFVDEFRPDLLHSHHPFLLGDAALRLAWSRRLPLVFTYHTMYEQYTHYVLDSDAIRRFAIQMSTDYCNLCSHVVAPSESVARLLAERGVMTPITSIPTGVDVERFAGGDGRRFRQQFGIAESAVVVGHVGRLAPEKNLAYLARAVGRFLAARPEAVFVVVGSGKSRDAVEQEIHAAARPEQLVMVDRQLGRELVDAYTAMDVFAFSSQSETQGMVLAEAMAAGVPAVALDGPGVREIVNDEQNGRLLAGDATEGAFAAALAEVTGDRERLKQLSAGARETTREFSIQYCADRLLSVYEELVRDFAPEREDPTPWNRLLGRLEIEWNLLVEKTSALVAAAREDEATRARLE